MQPFTAGDTTSPDGRCDSNRYKTNGAGTWHTIITQLTAGGRLYLQNREITHCALTMRFKSSHTYPVMGKISTQSTISSRKTGCSSSVTHVHFFLTRASRQIVRPEIAIHPLSQASLTDNTQFGRPIDKARDRNPNR